MVEATQVVGPAERETLKKLALAGAYGDQTRLPCADLGERLDYEPFAETLNVELDEVSARARSGLDGLDPVTIDGWESEDRTYGPAYCWPARVIAGERSYEPAHVIAPERTHHGRGRLEGIAPAKLRDKLGLADGNRVRVHVEE